MLTLVRPTIIYVHINKILFIIIELKSWKISLSYKMGIEKFILYKKKIIKVEKHEFILWQY